MAPPHDEPASNGTQTIREAALSGEVGTAARGRLVERFSEALIRLFAARGDQPGDAEDRAQEFVTKFFQAPRVEHLRPPMYDFEMWKRDGKFDQYVHFCAINMRKDALKKRKVPMAAQDVAEVEGERATTADVQFFKAVALAQWAEVEEEFRQKHVESGKGELFEQFLMQMSNDPDRVPYGEMAAAETACGRPTEPVNLHVVEGPIAGTTFGAVARRGARRHGDGAGGILVLVGIVMLHSSRGVVGLGAEAARERT